MLKRTLFIILFALLFANVAAAELPTLKGVRAGAYPDKFRFVLDFKDLIPDHFHYFTFNGKPAFVLELPATSIAKGATKIPIFKRDALISSLSIKKLSFRRVRMTVTLKYELPNENVKLFTLEDMDKKRLVLDLYRSYTNSAEYAISENLHYRLLEQATSSGYARFTEVIADTSTGKQYLDLICASSREKPSVMRQKSGATVAINGGFFAWGGGNLGLLVKDGKVISPHVSRRPPRSVFAILNNGQVFVDRMTSKSGVVYDSLKRPVQNIKLAIGGGPGLLKNGLVNLNPVAEGLGRGGNDITHTASRTAIGVDFAGKIHLFAATGYRDNHSEGIKLPRMAFFMKNASIKDGINLDGGGSTVMDILGTQVSRSLCNNLPERPVGNALLLYDNEPLYFPYSVGTVTSSSESLYADGKSGITLIVPLNDALGNPLPDGIAVKVIPSLGDAPYYTKTAAGTVTIQLSGYRTVSPISVSIECGALQTKVWEGTTMPGTPTRFYATVTQSEEQNAKFLDFVVEDQFGNEISDLPLRFDFFTTEPTPEATPLFSIDTTSKEAPDRIKFESELSSGYVNIIYEDKIVESFNFDLTTNKIEREV